MGIEEAGFREFSQTEGKVSMMGDQMPYKSRNFMNAEGTIGCAEVEVTGKACCMFISKTGKGAVMTMVGQANGPLPIPIEGYESIMCFADGSTFEDSYKVHQDALKGKAVVADGEWLKKTVPEIPQRAFDATMKMFQDFTGAMEGAMKQLGDAMGQAMEAVGKGLSEALGGTAEAGEAKKPKAKKAGKGGKAKKKRG